MAETTFMPLRVDTRRLGCIMYSSEYGLMEMDLLTNGLANLTDFGIFLGENFLRHDFTSLHGAFPLTVVELAITSLEGRSSFMVVDLDGLGTDSPS